MPQPSKFPKRLPARILAPPPPLEHVEQGAFFQWAMLNTHTYPGIELLYSIPNGSYKLGHRLAALFKRTGLRAGVPDMALPVPRAPFHGLYIEMKRVGSSPSDTSPDQRAWRAALRAQGYAAVEAHGEEEAREAIEWYYLDHPVNHSGAELLAERDHRAVNLRSERKMRRKVSLGTGKVTRDH